MFHLPPNQPCVVLPLADLHLPVSVANLHLPHLCHMCRVQTAAVCRINVIMLTAKQCDGGSAGYLIFLSSSIENN